MVFGYGVLLADYFVGFQKDLTQGAWKAVPTGHSKNGETPLHKMSVLTFFKEVLTRAIGGMVAAQNPANDTGVEARWSKSQRRFVARVQVLVLDEDPATVEAATKVQSTLADGGSKAMVKRSADRKVDFGRNQLALAASPDVAALIKQLGLTDAIDSVRECTDELEAMIGRGAVSTENLPRSRRIEAALNGCTAAFNLVHAGLVTMSEHTEDPATRAELDAMIAPLDALLARRPAVAATTATQPEPAATTAATIPAQPPLAHTG